MIGIRPIVPVSCRTGHCIDAGPSESSLGGRLLGANVFIWLSSWSPGLFHRAKAWESNACSENDIVKSVPVPFDSLSQSALNTSLTC
eukprot:scaffold382083_cov15-Prasinocladus_malaysianus.AAC.1